MSNGISTAQRELEKVSIAHWLSIQSSLHAWKSKHLPHSAIHEIELEQMDIPSRLNGPQETKSIHLLFAQREINSENKLDMESSFMRTRDFVLKRRIETEAGVYRRFTWIPKVRNNITDCHGWCLDGCDWTLEVWDAALRIGVEIELGCTLLKQLPVHSVPKLGCLVLVSNVLWKCWIKLGKRSRIEILLKIECHFLRN